MAEKYTPNKPKDAGLEARQKTRLVACLSLFSSTSNQSIKYYFNVLKWPNLASLDSKRQLQLKHAFGYCAIDRSIDYR